MVSKIIQNKYATKEELEEVKRTQGIIAAIITYIIVSAAILAVMSFTPPAPQAYIYIIGGLGLMFPILAYKTCTL